MEFKIDKIEDWHKIVDLILPQLKHNILLLKGNLGAGKTTFTQFLLKALKSSDAISSPTYTIVNEYQTPKGPVFHMDLYRMNSVEEVMDIGIEEYIDQGFLCIIEWPEIYEQELFGHSFHQIQIKNNNTEREISFK